MSGPMHVSFIVAMDRRGVIGKDGGLPWRLPADLQWFKRNTLGHHIIMGRVTYESVGRPLPGRTNVVVTRNPRFDAPGCQVVQSLDEALRRAGEAGDAEAFVIGGAQLYAVALPHCDRIYLTTVEAEVDGDTRFPALDRTHWREVFHEAHEADADHRYAFAFSILERRIPTDDEPKTQPVSPA